MPHCLQIRLFHEIALGPEAGAAPHGLAERIASLRSQLAETAGRAGRDVSAITLVGVTKRQSRDAVLEALAAGLSDFGENYVQEAREKYEGVAARKHFIGHVQTNKAKAIVATFDVVQSIDRLDAGRAIAKAARDAGEARFCSGAKSTSAQFPCDSANS